MKKKIVLFIFVLTYYTSAVQAKVPELERDVLMSLYILTGGSSWISSTGWLGAAGTECSWEGVSCSDNHIVSLNLNNKGLTGNIPKILGRLKNLKELDLSNNKLSGKIPSVLGNNSSGLHSVITTLDSTIPPHQGMGLNLEILHLHNNQLSGNIPLAVLSSRYLEILTLHNNQLTGILYFCETEIPIITAIGTGVQVVDNDICSGLFTPSGSLSGIGNDILGNNQKNLHTVTLFDNCFTVDLSILPPEAIDILIFDLGNQNVCEEGKSNEIPFVKTIFDFDIKIPSIDVSGDRYEVDLARYHLSSNDNGWYWQVKNILPISFSIIEQVEQSSAVYDIETSKLKFNKIYLGAKIIEATLQPYMNPSDPHGIYFQYIP